MCCQKGGQKYEGVPLDKKWRTFEGFVKDNWIRYYRAVIKWRNYKRVAPKKGLTGKLTTNYVKFKRKVKELGYTKENTVFTSHSDSMKYAGHTHKYMFEDKLLGTRDIKNILCKRGINLTMAGITNRLNSGMDLFAPSVDDLLKWKGKYKSFVDIAEMENVNYDTLKHMFYKTRDIKQAVINARENKCLVRYEFEGKQLLQSEICEILSQRTGIKKETLSGRFKKYGLDMDKLVVRLGYKGFSSTAKKIVAEKDGVEQEFNSIGDAAKILGLYGSLISRMLSGHIKHTGGYKFKYLK